MDSEVKAELLGLARPVADIVARHLVATGQLIDEEPALALEHAMAARRLASRISAVREAAGLAAYHAGEWASAIAELRTYHRMTGRQTHLAILADCERALGRPEKAIDLFRAAERDKLGKTEALELLIVAAGARGDLGQHDAAAAMLQVRELTSTADAEWVPRLRYAYADALLASGRPEEAREWFARAADADPESITDAAERLLELDGVELSGDDEDDEDEDSADVDRESDEDEDEDEDEDDAESDDDDDDEDDDDDREDDDADEDDLDEDDDVADDSDKALAEEESQKDAPKDGEAQDDEAKDGNTKAQPGE